MATLANVVIQDLTYTEKQLGSGVTISYTNGSAIAVSVSGHAISVAIVSGTSTATAIKAAVDAHPAASLLVTVTVSGTGSNAQKTCKSAALANGSVAVKASKQIGGILYEAKAAGTAGNSIRIKYVNHAETLSAVADTNDITVTFQSGVTKMSAIMALIRADNDCNALVSVSQVVPDSEQLIAYAADFTALEGGAAAVAPSVTVQDMKFAYNTADGTYNGKTVTYTTGATAGAEDVSVSNGNLTVQIENGVSTATQIKTAIEAEATAVPAQATGTISLGGDNAELADESVTVNGVTLVEGVDWNRGADINASAVALEAAIEAIDGISSSVTDNVITISSTTPGLAANSITLATSDQEKLAISGPTLTGGHDGFVVTIPGTAGTAQVTVNEAAPAGAVGDNVTGFYKDQAATALTNAFVLFSWPFHSREIHIHNDETAGTDTIVGSFDGVNTHFTLTFGQSLVIEVPKNGLYLKYANAAPNYRLIVIA